jgi:hypothetical protein
MMQKITFQTTQARCSSGSGFLVGRASEYQIEAAARIGADSKVAIAV